MSSTSPKFGRVAWTFAREGIGRSFAKSGNQRPSFSFKFAFFQYRPISQHHVRRHCSGGLLLLGLDSSSSSTQTIGTACNATAVESAISGGCSGSDTVGRLARQVLIRHTHTTSGSAGRLQQRFQSTKAGQGKDERAAGAPQESAQPQPQSPKTNPDETNKKVAEGHDSLTESVSKYLHLPKMPHRPTKDELLAAANGFWDRLKVRFKWFSIRSTRPFNADEWGAFLSWILFGHFVWILVGTTTFFSLLILMVNTVFAQGM